MKFYITFLLLALPAFLHAETLQHGGYKRHYKIYVPASCTASRKVPLLFVLHGGGGKAKRMARFTRFNRYADRDSFIIVYPDAYKRHWNDGRHSPVPSQELNIDDVGFINALLEKLEKELPVDASRVYACGPSNGGMMCYRLACELPGKFAAIAPLISSMPADLASSCRAAEPVPMIIINGTEDPLMPFGGGDVHFFKKKLGKVLSTYETAELWARNNHCGTYQASAVTPASPVSGDPTTVTKRVYECPAQADLQLYIVKGGGHAWPGGPQYLPKAIIGVTSRQMDATEVIWNFLKQHRRAGR